MNIFGSFGLGSREIVKLIGKYLFGTSLRTVHLKLVPHMDEQKCENQTFSWHVFFADEKFIGFFKGEKMKLNRQEIVLKMEWNWINGHEVVLKWSKNAQKMGLKVEFCASNEPLWIDQK